MRYLCQFRDLGKENFVTDCGFDNPDQAKSYVERVVTTLLHTVAEGKVFDYEQRQVIHEFTVFDIQAGGE